MDQYSSQSEPIVDSMDEPVKACVALTKARYKILTEAMYKEYEKDAADEILNIIKKALNFDPDKSNYDAESKRKTMEYRAKLKEKGISSYVSSGRKAHYEKNKIK